jgi:mRNA interferase MazF
MTTYRPGEILLVHFPFTSGGPGKNRPPLVLLNTGDADVVLARITTAAQITPRDVPLMEWQAASLLAPSMVRLHKLATLDKGMVLRPLGQIGQADRAQIASILAGLFAGW